MQITKARPLDFPLCPLGDKCVQSVHVNHDHRFDTNHQVWFGAAQTLLSSGQIYDGMGYHLLSVRIDNLLKGVDYAIKGYVRDYALTLIEVR